MFYSLESVLHLQIHLKCFRRWIQIGGGGMRDASLASTFDQYSLKPFKFRIILKVH